MVVIQIDSVYKCVYHTLLAVAIFDIHLPKFQKKEQNVIFGQFKAPLEPPLGEGLFYGRFLGLQFVHPRNDCVINRTGLHGSCKIGYAGFNFFQLLLLSPYLLLLFILPQIILPDAFCNKFNQIIVLQKFGYAGEDGIFNVILPNGLFPAGMTVFFSAPACIITVFDFLVIKATFTDHGRAAVSAEQLICQNVIRIAPFTRRLPSVDFQHILHFIK